MSQDSGWLKRLLGAGARADLTLEDAVAMLRDKSEALAMHEQLLLDRHGELERLSREEQQALSKLATLSEERSEMERKLEESLVAARVAETQLLAERIAQRAAAARAQELAASLAQAHHEVGVKADRIALLEKQQAQQAAGLHYERRRWRGLVGVFWQALEQALGPAAGLPVARALAAEGDLREAVEGERAASAAEAAVLLAQALRTRALGGGAHVAERAEGLQIRIEPVEPPLPEEAVPAWVGLVATHLLGRLLGRPLVLATSEQVGAALWVRARYRVDRPVPASPAPKAARGLDSPG